MSEMKKIKYSIKMFRVWDNIKNKMLDVEGINSSGEVLEYAGFSDDSNNSTLYTTKRDLEIMQHTGMYDKNGNPIFEGDIVRSVSNVSCNCQDCKTKVHRDTSGGEIVFENGIFGYYSEKYGEIFTLDNPEDFEVIGNIYGEK